MTYTDAIILGILQGMTEILPVSSSGHLVIAQGLLGVKQPGVSFEILVHLGSLLSILVFFRKKISLLIRSLYDPEYSEYRPIILMLAIGSVPAAVFGLLFKDMLEQAFSSPALASSMILVTGLILISTRYIPAGEGKVGVKSSFLIGLGQAISIMPGISRSGSTIAIGLFLRIKPEDAAEFSFLLSVPAIAGAALLEARELMAVDTGLAGPYLAGTVCAFIFSMVSLHTVLSIIRRRKFEYFAFYCFAVGAFGLYLFL